VPSADVPFERIAHLLAVPATVGRATAARFVLDTGFGTPAIAASLAGAIGVRPDGGTFTGRRMSGQAVTLPTARLPRLAFGRLVWTDVRVALVDTDGFPAPLRDVGGFLSLGLFRDAPFTVAYRRRRVRASAAPSRRPPPRDEATLHVRREGGLLDSFVDLELPDGHVARAEVDTGSDALILDRRFMRGLGVAEGDPGVRTVSGRDETGHRYVRHFARVPGTFRLKEAPRIAQRDPTVLFQRILHDGLVGDAFLRRYDVTYDLPRARIGFAPARQ
jgi:hypothetical protein